VKPSLTYRRLGFAVIVIVVMAGAAGIAVNVGYLLVKDADNQGEVLGTVALVVSPALTLLGALGAILSNLLRNESG